MNSPRTDKFLANCHCPNGKNVVDKFTKADLANFARQLEMELQAESLRVEALRDALIHEQDVAQHHMHLYMQRLSEGDESCRTLGSEAWRRHERIRAALAAHSEGIHKAAGPQFTVNGNPSPETAKAISEMVKCVAERDHAERLFSTLAVVDKQLESLGVYSLNANFDTEETLGKLIKAALRSHEARAQQSKTP